MKTITVKQPWASLIVEGIKDVENRTWPTKFRGRVLIHASSKSWDWYRFINYMTSMGALGVFTAKWTRKWLSNLTTGAIIGSVEIVDCVIDHKSIWAEKSFDKPKIEDYVCNENDCGNMELFKYNLDLWKRSKPIYNWVLSNPIKFDNPIPAKGKLSFWEFADEQLLKIK